MKSAFLLIDSIILTVFERAAKWFNWLTGKDNFFLARQLAIIQFLLVFVFSVISGDLIFGICFLLPTFWAFLFSRKIEEKRRLEQVRGVKKSELFYEMLFYRWGYTISALVVPMISVATSKTFLGKPVFITGMFLFVCIFWILSVEIPPFRKSEALAKLKEMAMSLKTKTTLTPIPTK